MHRHDAQVSEAELKDKHDELVVSPSNLNSFLCVAQSVAELTVLYPNDEKLMGVAKQAWSTVFQSSLLAQMMWIIRTRSVLGL